jgi:regulator of sigma E protease
MVLLSNIWWLLVLIGVMILIHELGHYWAARFFDVRVETFSFGFGPRLFGFRRGETDFRFSAILFGGYVKMAGEQPGEDNADPRSFSAKPRWQRLIIAAAGPLMNIILAVALLTGLYMFEFPRPANYNDPATIGYIQPGSPAEKAGLKPGDRILQVNSQQNPTWQDVAITEITSAKKPMVLTVQRGNERLYLQVTPELDERTGGTAGWMERTDIQIQAFMENSQAQKAGLKEGDVITRVNGQPIYAVQKLHDVLKETSGKPVQVTYRRGKDTGEVAITPTYSDPEGNGKGRWMLGVQLEPPVVLTQLSFVDALKESIAFNWKQTSAIYQFLQGLVERRMSPKSLEGPIRIAQLSGAAARQGPTAFFMLMTMVSLNLAIFNLLPIPILDGGMILLLLIEMFMRRDLSMPVKEAFLKVGMVFLMVVVVFVLYNDISKILPG